MSSPKTGSPGAKTNFKVLYFLCCNQASLLLPLADAHLIRDNRFQKTKIKVLLLKLVVFWSQNKFQSFTFLQILKFYFLFNTNSNILNFLFNTNFKVLVLAILRWITSGGTQVQKRVGHEKKLTDLFLVRWMAGRDACERRPI